MFGSPRVRLATLLVGGAAALTAVWAADRYETSRATTALRADRAAIEAAAQRLFYAEAVNAWTRLKLHDPAALAAITSSIGVPPRTVYEDGEAIIFAFPSGFGTQAVCIDLAVRPQGNTVETRPC